MTTNTSNYWHHAQHVVLLICFMCCSSLVDARDDGKQLPADIERKFLELHRKKIESVFESSPVKTKTSRSSGGDIFILLYADSSKTVIVLRADKNGATIWDINNVSINTKGYVDTPSCYPDSDNGCFVVWKEVAPDRLVIRRISSAGETRWESNVVEQQVTHYDITQLKENNLLLAASNRHKICLIRISGSGKAIWQTEPILPEQSESNPGPVATNLFSDDFALLTWLRRSHEDRFYVAQKIDLTNGKAVWGQARILGPVPITLRLPPLPKFSQHKEGILVRLPERKDTVTHTDNYDVIVPFVEYEMLVKPDGNVERLPSK